MKSFLRDLDGIDGVDELEAARSEVKIIDLGGGVKQDGWYQFVCWGTPTGVAELWYTWAANPPVRVAGDVPHALFALGPGDIGSRSDADVALFEGLPAEVEGHSVVFRMPKRGWSRDDRRVFIEIDGVEYVARPRSLGAVDLRRPDGTRVWRHGFFSERLADDITPVEVTVAALCRLVDLLRRTTRNPIRWV